MSELKVEVVKIDNVFNHENADRLEVCQVAGWSCITRKGEFNKGQRVVYIPIDSILPEKLESFIFPPESKITLSGHRVKTIKLRGVISQGILLDVQELIDEKFLVNGVSDIEYKIGEDVADELKITKYEPPVRLSPQSNVKQVKKRDKHPDFKEFTDINNFKWYPTLFKENEHVVVLEKLHGSNFRAALLPYHASTWWKKVKKFVGVAPKYEFCYGSHRVQMQYKKTYNGYYDKNIYLEMVKKYGIEDKLSPGEILYGEVIGDGVQKGYLYGCKPGERKLVIFDVKKDGVYQNHLYVKRFCNRNKLDHAPIEYVGQYKDVDHLKTYVDGESSYCKDQKIREGIVIKPFIEEQCYMGRKVLKFKSDNFLLTQIDDSH
jgi:RNA ligase (TIGR02306 family)